MKSIYLYLVYIRHMPSSWHRFYLWDSNWKKFSISVLVSLGYFAYLLSLSISIARSIFFFSLHSFISLFALLSALFITCTGLPIIRLPSISIHCSTSVHILVYIVMKNVAFLMFGIILCNFIGTLAASVLLFPSFISQNASRLDHTPTQQQLIIFFIILIGNSGGVLSPLGDPPLYMGYINGVRFLFTFEYLYKIFLLVNGYTLLIFALIDLVNALLKRQHEQTNESQAHETELCQRLDTNIPNDEIRSNMNRSRYDLTSTYSSIDCSWHGTHHLPFLILILVIIACKGLHIPRAWPIYLQETMLILVTIACLLVDMLYNRLTPIDWYKRNYSTRMEPVIEVLVIFVGLLFTMSAPISVLTTMNVDIGPKVYMVRTQEEYLLFTVYQTMFFYSV
jgi:uncharacterized membrane protein